MEKNMSDFFGKLKSGAGKVAKEADRVAHVKRIEMEIGSIKKQIETQYNKLGEMTYSSSINNEPENPESKNVIAKISELNQQIKVKGEDIKKINQGDIEPQSAEVTPATLTSGKKVCNNCGKENDPNVKFCSECGTKMD
jgi:capsule polysaccharide export protein KpsE/RkpR